MVDKDNHPPVTALTITTCKLTSKGEVLGDSKCENMDFFSSTQVKSQAWGSYACNLRAGEVGIDRFLKLSGQPA